MEKWRISRIKLNFFKALETLEESYDEDLIVYDGPNGFGKTSLYDAKQLLFCGKIPRVHTKFKSLKIKTRTFDKNLYCTHGYNGDVKIIVELTRGEESLVVMRKAIATDLQDKKQNHPTNFESYKLYELTSFENTETGKLITDEEAFWSDHLGTNFRKNYDVLNYLQQDSKAIVIPDGSVNDKPRASQIEHLINLDGLNTKLNRLGKLKEASGVEFNAKKKNVDQLQAEVNELIAKVSNSTNNRPYKNISTFDPIPSWDREQPFSQQNTEDVPVYLQHLELLKELVEQKAQLAIKVRNGRVLKFVQKQEFKSAVRLAPFFSQIDTLRESKAKLRVVNDQLSVIEKIQNEIKSDSLSILQPVLAEGFQKLKTLITQREKLSKKSKETSDSILKIIPLRDKLAKSVNKEDAYCPLCGYDYEQEQILLKAIQDQGNKLQEKLDKNQKEQAKLTTEIDEILEKKKVVLNKEATRVSSTYNEQLLDDLELNLPIREKLSSIAERIVELDITLPKEYATDAATKDNQLSEIKQLVLDTLEPEVDEISEEAMSLYAISFKSPEDINQLSIDDITQKHQYLLYCYSKLISVSLVEKQKELAKSKLEVKYLKELHKDLEVSLKAFQRSKNEYINQTVGQMESLFHIYSGRLLQNYQCGLGVFINMPSKEQSTTVMSFVTARGREHDAVLSMSSGQISALSLSLFLALNKKYAQTAFLFIDDPTQSMDEINIASLSDLLRVEFRDRQVIISTHEQDISDYLCYRYGKAGLTRKSINLQRKQTHV